MQVPVLERRQAPPLLLQSEPFILVEHRQGLRGACIEVEGNAKRPWALFSRSQKRCHNGSSRSCTVQLLMAGCCLLRATTSTWIGKLLRAVRLNCQSRPTWKAVPRLRGEHFRE